MYRYVQNVPCNTLHEWVVLDTGHMHVHVCVYNYVSACDLHVRIHTFSGS